MFQVLGEVRLRYIQLILVIDPFRWRVLFLNRFIKNENKKTSINLIEYTTKILVQYYCKRLGVLVSGITITQIVSEVGLTELSWFLCKGIEYAGLSILTVTMLITKSYKVVLNYHDQASCWYDLRQLVKLHWY